MNTLQDLRATLDQHAGDVADDASVARVAAVRGRARRARQQRAGAVVVAAVLAVGAAVVVPSLGGGRTPQPADAPDTLTSLGWTYRLASTDSASGRVVQDLESSETPRLVSWATAGSLQRVAVRQPGVESWTSDAGDYDDFAWVPPGSGSVTLTAAGGGDLDVAVYELDASASPPGVGEGPLTFRSDVAGRVLVGAAVGEPGDSEVVVPVDADRGTLWLAHTCEGLPRGYEVRIGVVGQPGYVSSGGSCADDSFDPGGSPSMGMPGHWGPGAALRVWITRGGDPVADGELPDVRLGLGAYSLDVGALRIAGTQVAGQVEHAGRVWDLDQASSSEVGRNQQLPWVTVPDEAGRFAVQESVSARGALRYTLTADGRRIGSAVTLRGIGGGSGDLTYVEPGARVSLEVGTPLERVDEAGLALYRLVD